MTAKPAIDTKPTNADDNVRQSAEFERAATILLAPWEEGDWDRSTTAASPSRPISAASLQAAVRSDPPSQVIRLGAAQVVSDRPKPIESTPAPNASIQSWSNAPQPAVGAVGAPTFSSIPPLTPSFGAPNAAWQRDSGADFPAAVRNTGERKYGLYIGIGVAAVILLAFAWQLFAGRGEVTATPIAAESGAKPPDTEEQVVAAAAAPSEPAPVIRHRLSINSNVAAQVSVDGQAQEGLENIELADGQHSVVVSADGYQPETRRVNLTRDTSISVQLRAESTGRAAAAPSRHRGGHGRRPRPATSIRRSGFVSRNPY